MATTNNIIVVNNIGMNNVSYEYCYKYISAQSFKCQPESTNMTITIQC